MDQEIREFYAQGFEPGRLRVGGNGRLEFLRTQEIVRRFVGERSRVLDVGGASGVHAAWLAEDGHDVLVVDAMPSHVELAGGPAVPGCRDARDGDRAAPAAGGHGVVHHGVAPPGRGGGGGA